MSIPLSVRLAANINEHLDLNLEVTIELDSSSSFSSASSSSSSSSFSFSSSSYSSSIPSSNIPASPEILYSPVPFSEIFLPTLPILHQPRLRGSILRFPLSLPLHYLPLSTTGLSVPISVPSWAVVYNGNNYLPSRLPVNSHSHTFTLTHTDTLFCNYTTDKSDYVILIIVINLLFL